MSESSVLAVMSADTHLSELVWSSRPTIRLDAFYAFSQLVDAAISHSVPLVIAGDCMELLRTGSPTSEVVSFVRKQISRLRERDLPLYYIDGQHDGLADPSWLGAIHEWAVDVDQQEFSLGDFRWWGIRYTAEELLRERISEIPAGVFGVLMHQSWKEFVGGGGGFATASLSALVGKAPVVFSGDTHLVSHVRIGDMLAISPGATHRRNLREPLFHSYCVLNSNGSFNSFALKGRTYFELVVGDMITWAQQLEQLPDFCRDLTLKSLEAGIWPEVATPVMILKDPNGIGASQMAESLRGIVEVIPVVSESEKASLGRGAVVWDGDFSGISMGEYIQTACRSVGVDEVCEQLILAAYQGQDVMQMLKDIR